MKTIAVIFVALALLCVCLPALAQDNADSPVVVEPAPAPPGPAADAPAAPPAPPVAPPTPGPRPNSINRPAVPNAPGAPPAMMSRSRDVVVGPTDSKVSPRRVRGKVTVVAVPPASAAVSSVEVFFNAALVGQTSAKPYKVDFNTDTVSPGVHTFKAVGLDSSGKQIWTATTAVEVSSASGATTGIPTRTLTPPPTATTPKPGTPAPTTPVPAVTTPKPVTPVTGAAVALGKTYANSNFMVKYPSGWAVRDQSSAMKPKKSGNVWVSFSDRASSTLVVNIRRMRVAPKTTAEVFAKYNPYVGSWDRKTILGSQAFTTTSGTVESKSIIHRLIVIRSGYAWMINCVDTSGDSPAKSRALFDSVVASLVVKDSSPTRTVTVREKGKH